MVCWPTDYDGAWTLAGSARRSGIGLHSGDEVAVLLHPWPEAGVWVSWSGGQPRCVSSLPGATVSSAPRWAG